MTRSTSTADTEAPRGRTPTRRGGTQASQLSITITDRPRTPPRLSILDLEPEAIDDTETMTKEEQAELMEKQKERSRALALTKSMLSK